MPTQLLRSSEDWRAIRNTLHLLTVPDMRKPIKEGVAESVDHCATEPGWRASDCASFSS
ncbi:hypothetical protein [Roseateles saccharophilus]|uniref:Uncharacterized protein n=1 Tax=Roseateles saccharophilus TaxID=304 RepID=A0A4R3V7A6_ROSSA|nr:hypothetical protein [Roseateles saccharophilus]TCV00997.1 hypothetical protein EV671_1007126 [Roseateles saccharophilus]